MVRAALFRSVALAVGVVGLAGLGLSGAGEARPRVVHVPPPVRVADNSRSRGPNRPVLSQEVFYPNCAAVRAAGVAPLMRGQPGYRRELDRDDDGLACEPWRGRR